MKCFLVEEIIEDNIVYHEKLLEFETQDLRVAYRVLEQYRNKRNFEDHPEQLQLTIDSDDAYGDD